MKLLSNAKWKLFERYRTDNRVLHEEVDKLEDILAKQQALLSASGFTPSVLLMDMAVEEHELRMSHSPFYDEYTLTKEDLERMAKDVIGRQYSGDEVKLEPADYPEEMEAPEVTAERKRVEDIVRPAHYRAGGVDVIEYAEHHVPREQMIGFHRINVLKYLTRYDKKNGVEDLKKAQFYLDKLIQLEEVPFDA